jgi:MoxR-like ATPase
VPAHVSADLDDLRAQRAAQRGQLILCQRAHSGRRVHLPHAQCVRSTVDIASAVSREGFRALQRHLEDVYVATDVARYMVEIVRSTRRHPAVQVGASPRGSLALLKLSRASAALDGRDFVTPEDVKAIGPDVLRHRLVLSYEAEAEEVTAEHIVRRVFEVVEVP